jgi:hypothetical protein
MKISSGDGKKLLLIINILGNTAQVETSTASSTNQLSYKLIY